MDGRDGREKRTGKEETAAKVPAREKPEEALSQRSRGDMQRQHSQDF
jgi:hypothetical protein